MPITRPDPYLGGDAWTYRNGTWQEHTGDLWFRVGTTPVQTSQDPVVPEPSSWLIFALGTLGWTTAHIRRRRRSEG